MNRGDSNGAIFGLENAKEQKHGRMTSWVVCLLLNALWLFLGHGTAMAQAPEENQAPVDATVSEQETTGEAAPLETKDQPGLQVEPEPSEPGVVVPVTKEQPTSSATAKTKPAQHRPSPEKEPDRLYEEDQGPVYDSNPRCTEVGSAFFGERGNNCWGDERINFSRTAFGVEKGETTVTGYGGFLWVMNHGLTDWMELNVTTVLPIMVYGATFGFSFHTDREKDIAYGVGVRGGIGGIMASMYGLGYTAGVDGRMSFRFQSRLFLNLSLSLDTLGYSRSDEAPSILLSPSIGFRVAFSRNWSYQMEYMLPLNKRDGAEFIEPSDAYFGLLIYGFRVHGDLVFGDFGFMLPLGYFYLEGLAMYAPLGVPYLSLGFHF